MKIGINKVRPGMFLQEGVFGSSLVYPLIPAGEMLTETNIERLKRNGITEIDVKFKKDVEETISEELQDSITESLKKFNVKEIVDNAKSLVTSVLNTKYLSFSLAKYYNNDDNKNNIYGHSINVASFAVSIAKILNNSQNTVQVNYEHLAVAALLHDIGKLCEEEKTFDNLEKLNLKKETFTKFDIEDYYNYEQKNYPLYGYNMLHDLINIPSVVKNAVLLQQENERGTGLLGVDANFMKNDSNPSVLISKIIKVANWYEFLIENIVKMGLSPSNVIEIMNQLKSDKRISNALTDILLQNVPLYSVGSLVYLSTGEVAKVIELNYNSLDKPIVQTLVANEVIDLSSVLNITISSIPELDILVYDQEKNLDEIPIMRK